MRGEFVDRHGNAMTVIGIVYIDPRDHWQRTMGLTDPDFPAAVEALREENAALLEVEKAAREVAEFGSADFEYDTKLWAALAALDRVREGETL